ncbi:unnamed protein product [Prorocentrum cordatum]|uniref:Uncharacterized protein n=1 Tax=Prorocentrum cordatum TaxID=2364126 RepID=A0ABN9PI22_9DINO|nr:unnamed protein product [Polarella glacialis]
MEDGQKNLQEACVKAGTRGPSQSPGNAKLDKIKSMAEAVAATSSSPGAAASGDAGNLAILQAIGVLSDKMGNMALKSDLEEPTLIWLNSFCPALRLPRSIFEARATCSWSCQPARRTIRDGTTRSVRRRA